MSAELQELHPHDHPCLIYESKEEQVAAFVPYLQSGLVQGEKCVYIVDDSSPGWIHEQLRANDFPIDDYVANGAFTIITKNDAYLLDGYFDTKKMCDFWSEAIKQANEAGFPALRAAAEMTWALGSEPGCGQLVNYESHLNNVFPNAKVSALCQYNRKRFNASIVKEMIHVHPLIVVGGEVISNPGFIQPEEFIESHAEMDVQALLDNLVMTKRLANANAELREALAAQSRTQELIEERQQQYEHMYQELQSLARVISHEMQAPLKIMQSYLGLLSTRYKGRLGCDADDFIEKSVTSARLVGRMIDDLWNYARVDSYGDAFAENLDTADVLDEVLRELHDIVESESARVEAVTELPTINVSRHHLKFLFTALLTNSIRYARKDCRPEVEIGIKDDPDNWLFFVKDNGCGIDKIYSLDVFKLFHRLSEKPSEDGTGMGLAICSRIIDHYEGSIWFESEGSHETGTTFWFSIPKHPAPENSNIMHMRDFAASRANRIKASNRKL